MAYKDAKTRLELVKKITNRNKNLESPFGDFCNDTIYTLNHLNSTNEQLEELLKTNVADFFSVLSRGNMCYEAEKQMKIFIKRFNQYCKKYNL